MSDCADLTQAGETYVLTADITTTDPTCFLVLADRITIDLAGHTVTGPGTSAVSFGVRNGGGASTLTVVKSGSIKNFQFGIFLNSSTRNTVEFGSVGIFAPFGRALVVKNGTITEFGHGVVAGPHIDGHNRIPHSLGRLDAPPATL